jgi:hypothetical protein
MIPFQMVGIALFALLGVYCGRRLAAGTRPRWLLVAGLALSALGMVTIYDPDLTTRLARRLGIGRGADLLLYVLVLAFIGSWFLFYQRLRALQGAVTRLVRELALRDAGARGLADHGAARPAPAAEGPAEPPAPPPSAGAP